MKLGRQSWSHKGQAAIKHYANQTACPLWPLCWGPNSMPTCPGYAHLCLNSVLAGTFSVIVKLRVIFGNLRLKPSSFSWLDPEFVVIHPELFPWFVRSCELARLPLTMAVSRPQISGQGSCAIAVNDRRTFSSAFLAQSILHMIAIFLLTKV